MNQRRQRSVLLLALSLSIGLGLGCSKGPTVYTVSGEVTYQGKPVESGDIAFADAARSDRTASGTITDGRYSLQTTAGKKLVRITATKETGKMITGAMDATYPEIVDLIPEKYNTATTLEITVDPGQSTKGDFHLE